MPHSGSLPQAGHHTHSERRGHPCTAHRRHARAGARDSRGSQTASAAPRAALQRSHRQQGQAGVQRPCAAGAAAADGSGGLPEGSGRDTEPSPPSAPASRSPWLRALALLRPLLRHLLGSFWSIALAFALSDAAQFAVHRLSSRLVNACAQTFLAGKLDPAAIGNLWWMSNNPVVASFDTGYQYLAIACFVLSYPLTILLRTAASTAAILVCTRPQEGDAEGGARRWRIQPLSQAVGPLRAVAGDVRAMLGRIWQVDLRVTVQALPLQAASLLLLPLPWSLPRLLALMLATPVAVLEGNASELAVERARRLAKRVPWQQAVPYIALLLVYQGLMGLRKLATEAMPQRFFTDVPEVPAAAYLAVTLLALVASRALDLLPFTAYQEARKLEKADTAPA